jgi:hypothetical protein
MDRWTRRAPVTIVSQTRTAQSGSSHEALRMRAASADVGGCGFAEGCLGGSAFSMGLRDNQRHRTARRSAPLRITWIWRIVDWASGLQT